MTVERRYRMHAGRAALDAVASPARQELLLALGEGRASVRELAARLGRSRSALHYHAGVLERAGILRAVEVRGSGRERETVYAQVPGVGVRARETPAQLDGSRRAAEAMLRLTQREVARALKDKAVRGATVGRVLAGRGKARLGAAQLARANALIDELLALFAGTPSERGKLHAITVVLVPSRDASTPTPTPRRRRRRRRS